MEQEIKLVVLGDAELDLEAQPCLSQWLSAPVQQIHLSNTYFDTPDKALFKHGAGLRLRQIGEQWLQTVKTTGQVVNGLHQRDEWEHSLSGPQFDLNLLSQTILKPLIENKKVWSTLGALFSTDFVRTLLHLSLDDGTEIEVAYDRGVVTAGTLSVPIHEIELELKQGNLPAMQKIAEQLKAALALEYSDISKAQQGYELRQQFEFQ